MSIKSDKCKRFTRAPPTRIHSALKMEKTMQNICVIECLQFALLLERIKLMFFFDIFCAIGRIYLGVE